MKYKLLLFIAVFSVIGNIIFFSARFRKKSMDKKLKIEMTHRFNRQDIYELFPIDSNSIVFLGDSQTEFFDLCEFFNNYHIKNRGIARDRTVDLFERLNQVTMGNPKKLFIQIGVNDLSLNKEDNISSKVSVENTFKQTKKILTQIKNQCPDTKIYYQSVFPFSNVIDEIKELNKKTEDFCDENNIVFIDLFNDFAEDDMLKHDFDCGDGLHLNGKGYLKWHNIIEKYVND